MVVSSILVGSVSAVPLAIFNGQTMGHSMAKTWNNLSTKQVLSIVGRETSFLFSLRVSEPISKAMKERFGENKAVDIGSAFVSGAIGSLVGHPADAALTLWQKEMKVQSLRQLIRGAPIKAVTVGGFSICYQLAKDSFKSFE